jgi:hypothetical protein
MLIPQAEHRFIEYAQAQSIDLQSPQALISVVEAWLSFFESTRITDGTKEEGGWPDALLFEYGHREALLGYYGECFYLNLTRQFISQYGQDDDAMFQLVWQAEFAPTNELIALGHKSEWCDSLRNFSYFKGAVLSSPVLSALNSLTAQKFQYYFSAI